MHQEEIDEVVACMQSGWLGTGPRVARFESDFAAYNDVTPQPVAGVNSRTAAMHMRIAANLEPCSFCAMNSILHAGPQRFWRTLTPRDPQRNLAHVDDSEHPNLHDSGRLRSARRLCLRVIRWLHRVVALSCGSSLRPPGSQCWHG